MGKFELGVNYWASHAGTEMWRNWDENAVWNDLEALKEQGVELLRVFPIWRDFQPVAAAWGGGHSFREYRMDSDAWPENPYFLDPVMMERFHKLCAIAKEHGQKLIVGLLTGWMSGRLFVPTALQNRHIFTDPEALWMEQLFVGGFVRDMAGEPAIAAWDLGNECNCMEQDATRQQAANWTATVVNAIRAADRSRPVISGMHSLDPQGAWTPADQGFWTDILTTHPYPYWIEHCSLTPVDDYRALLHATAQTAYYAGLGEKPCLVEELGTMGPMISDEEIAASFLRVNLWSNWAHGSPGVLWWCAFDQNHLTSAPYDWNMCERELGMLRADRTPKPVAEAMRQFSEEQRRLGLDLVSPQTDAVCILTQGQDAWGVAYMSYLLAKQAGLTLRFTWQEQELPESRLYLMPSIRGAVMSKRRYEILKQRVRDGATLYISLDDAVLSEFEELSGFRVKRWARRPGTGQLTLEEAVCDFETNCQFTLVPIQAEVLARDSTGAPLVGRNRYGNGTVYLVNLPLETMLLTRPNGFDMPWYRIYEQAASGIFRLATKSGRKVGMTVHRHGDAAEIVLINYDNQSCETGLQFSEKVAQAKALYGDPYHLPPFETAIVRVWLKSGTF